MKRFMVSCLFVLCLPLVFIGAQSSAQSEDLWVWVEKNYNSWDNPLHSELIINGETVNIYSSETFESIQAHIKPGWNTIEVVTTPQQPASKENDLIFRIGPMYEDPANQRMVMQPVLWEFRNGTDWKFGDGKYSHPLGPNVQQVKLTFPVYFAGMDLEKGEVKEGDYLLVGKPNYNSWNSPVVGTVTLNGTPLNSFMTEQRQIIVTSLLKPGKNEIQLTSSRVPNALADNDIEFFIAGPAEWSVERNDYIFNPIVEFKAMQGWKKDPKTGQLVLADGSEQDQIERTIPFFLKPAQD